MRPDYILFTDASVRKNKIKTFAGYSYVGLNVTTGNYTTYSGSLNNESIVFAEAWAIYSGLLYIIKSNPTANILVVSDSKLNVDILTQYIPKGMWDMSGYVWKKSNGKPVKNQKLYKGIMNLLRYSSGKIKFIHINSHKNISDITDIINKFKKYNVTMNGDTAKVFLQMNSLADILATTVTDKMKNKVKENEYA